LVTGSFRSKARLGAQTGWAVSYPPGSPTSAPLPVLLSLHGTGGGWRDTFDGLHLDSVHGASSLATPMAIAAVDGGDTWFHARADGTDSGAMITDELLPLLAGRGLDTSRLALFGWSMGGWAALMLAGTKLRGKVRASVPLSAALWTGLDQAEDGAFDDEQDFKENDVFALRPVLESLPMRLACGLDDDFLAGNRDFVAGFTVRPETDFGPGGHTFDYWRATAPSQVAFASRYLT
jgi:pimeloyl-ACP methyl ester carboxylesterase